MALEVDAVYEDGILKLDREIPLDNGQRVHLTIQASGGRAKKSYGLMGWKGDAKTIEEIALDPDFGILESP